MALFRLLGLAAGNALGLIKSPPIITFSDEGCDLISALQVPGCEKSMLAA